MAGPIAPWLIPTDVIGSMSRGAQLGLSARSQDEAEASAADRLRLAYDQMAQEERRASELSAFRQQQAAQALQMKHEQAQMLNAYRQAEIQQKQSAAEALQKHYEDLAKHYETQDTKKKEPTDYGDILTQDLPGGATAVFRKGSPGLHVITRGRTATLSPTAAAALLKNLPETEARMGMAGTNSLTGALGPKLLNLISNAVVGAPSEGTTGTNIPGNFKIKAIRQKEPPADTVDEGMDDEEQ